MAGVNIALLSVLYSKVYLVPGTLSLSAKSTSLELLGLWWVLDLHNLKYSRLR